MSEIIAKPEESRLIVARRAPAEAVLQFYGMVGEAFGGYGPAQFAAALADANESKAVTLYMSSDGGDFFEGIAIYSQLCRFAESHDLTIVVDGIAASAASVIAMAARRLVMAPAAKLMIHEARVMRTSGTAGELEKLAANLRGASQTMAEVYAKRTGMPVAQINAFFASGDTFFTAEQAIDLGFADEIEGQPKPKRASAALDHERLIAAARINARLQRESRDAASRATEPGQPGNVKPQS